MMELEAITAIVKNQKLSTEKCLEKICAHLDENYGHYTWTGFYFVDPHLRKLYLGPYVGEPTEHITIPFGKGICGQVAVSGKYYLARDVSAEGNYIACSVDVQSELVVPLLYDKEIIGQIDIDSNQKDAFSVEDIEFLEAICSTLEEHRGEDLEAYRQKLLVQYR